MQNKVDFYLLPALSNLACWQRVCRLIEKFYQKQQKIYIHLASSLEAENLDRHLWTYREDNFLPHQLYQAENNECPIQLGFEEVKENNYFDVFINISNTLPTLFSTFKEIVEIVFPDPLLQQLARERYKKYREQQFHLYTHKVESTEL